MIAGIMQRNRQLVHTLRRLVADELLGHEPLLGATRMQLERELSGAHAVFLVEDLALEELPFVALDVEFEDVDATIEMAELCHELAEALEDKCLIARHRRAGGTVTDANGMECEAAARCRPNMGCARIH